MLLPKFTENPKYYFRNYLILYCNYAASDMAIRRLSTAISQIGRFELLGTNWDEQNKSFRIRYKVVQ